MSETLELRVNGRTYSGFLRGNVTQSLDGFASTWGISYSTEATTRNQLADIRAGDGVSLAIDGTDMFEGYVHTRESVWKPKIRTWVIKGYSKLGDLVDCHSFKRHPWRDASLLEIAEYLARDYGIEVEARDSDADVKFSRFAVEEGETIAQTLTRGAKLRGLILADEGGKLVISRAGIERSQTDIREGQNMLSSRRIDSWRERFSEYAFKGKTRATDDLYGEDAAIEGVVDDEEITRTRRFRVTAWGDKKEDLGVRALNERNTRAGRGFRLIADVKGWLDNEGKIWRPNTRVNVFDRLHGVNATLLITRTSAILGASTNQTAIELCRPEAYDLVTNYPQTARSGEIQ